MPALMTWGGVAFAVLGALVIFAGMPDRWAGLSMGSDLLHAGATLLAGGLIVAALGQVLRAVRDVADRVEEAGFGAAGRVINDELAEQTPVPLPRAAAPAVPAAPAAKPAAAPRPTDLVSKLEAEMQAEAAKRPEARAPQAPQQAAPETPPSPPREARETRDPLSRALRDRAAAPRPQRPERETPAAQPDQPRAAPRPPLTEQPAREEALAEEPVEPRRDTPRWMRPRQTPEAPPVETPPIPMPETVPVRPTRGPMAAAGTVPPPRVREPHPLPQYDSIPRRRREPEPPQPADEEEPGLVVRSGIIGGMAYTLYSDGSIEAELPIGTVRFGSLAELQEHVKRAGTETEGGDR